MISIQEKKPSSKGQLVSLQFKGESVRQDRDGRFSLNDLHRMAGSPPNQDPRQWARLDTTKALVEVVQDQQDLNVGISPIWKVLVSRRGNMGGTWAVMSLALAYASYLSPGAEGPGTQRQQKGRHGRVGLNCNHFFTGEAA